MQTRTGLTIIQKGNRIEVYTEKELDKNEFKQELNRELTSWENKLATALLVVVVVGLVILNNLNNA